MDHKVRSSQYLEISIQIRWFTSSQGMHSKNSIFCRSICQKFYAGKDHGGLIKTPMWSRACGSQWKTTLYAEHGSVYMCNHHSKKDEGSIHRFESNERITISILFRPPHHRPASFCSSLDCPVLPSLHSAFCFRVSKKIENNLFKIMA